MHNLLAIDKSTMSTRNPLIKPLTLPVAPVLSRTDVDNFNTWKQKLINYTMQQDVYYLINLAPVAAFKHARAMTGATKEDRPLLKAVFLSNHMKLTGAIRVGVYDAVGLTLFKTIEEEQKKKPTEFIENNANYLWNKLCSTYEIKSAQTTINLLNTFATWKINPDEDPLEMKKRFETAVMRMNEMEAAAEKAQGQTFSDAILAAFMLRGLPAEFDSMRQQFDTNPNLKYDDIIRALTRRYEANKPGSANTSAGQGDNNTNDGTEAAHGAFMQQRNKKKDTQKKRRFNADYPRTEGAVCNYCHKTNHTESQCVNKKRASKNTDSDDDEQAHIVHVACAIDHPVEDESECDDSDSEQYESESASSVITADLYSGDSNLVILDSAATRHLTPHKSLLTKLQSIPRVRLTTALRKTSGLITEAGSLKLNDRWQLHNVALVPGAGMTLMSEGKLCDAGYTILKSKDWALVYSPKTSFSISGKPVLRCPRMHRLWIYDIGGKQEKQKPIREKPTIGPVDAPAMKKVRIDPSFAQDAPRAIPKINNPKSNIAVPTTVTTPTVSSAPTNAPTTSLRSSTRQATKASNRAIESEIASAMYGENRKNKKGKNKRD